MSAPTVFAATASLDQYTLDVSRFLAGDTPAVPVWTDGRDDLAEAARRATDIYRASRRPLPRRYGVLLGSEPLPPALAAMIEPLAVTWLAASELDRDQPSDMTGDATLVIAGLYEQLTIDPVRAALWRWRGRSSLLTGRDLASLAWFVAKQYATVSPDVTAVGLYTSTDRPAPIGAVRVRDDRTLDEADTGAEVLDGRWRRLLLQGHGRDDSINLGDWTVCGLHAGAARSPELLGPRCAYGPDCYKPREKLLPLARIRAAEIVLSSCNNAPYPDAITYDPKYQLLLEAIDGVAQDVVAAPTVHHSDRPENEAWMRAAEAGASSVLTLNAVLGGSQPDDAYVHYGLPGDRRELPGIAARRPDPRVLTTAARLTAYLAGDLLPPSHPLRPRFTRMAAKVAPWTTRQAAAVSADRVGAELDADLQSLDHAIAGLLAKDPDNELTDFAGHFGERSAPDDDSAEDVVCVCGLPARRFVRRAWTPTALDTVCVLCERCGDVTLRLTGAPELAVEAPAKVAAGGVLPVRLRVTGARPGPVRVGVYVPRYLRGDCVVEPAQARLRVSAGRPTPTAEFTLTMAADVPPQAYYLTAYGVQDLGLSLTRWDFGVEPAATGPSDKEAP
ncbi:hypothetical protein [Paractinoplanes atraurantiacus]|uniref:Uncharacterized protein n=1 Tax=Paractinoplanes atraurantiacus TaxID=1036182 RepID=A0A285J036_9ACTN|nr:hypothetical protein [Actinoplanes atraurantiacus]SNY53578.1 hypothetical protein SAMN05421748_11470 [Actinoplanes atraurantiacus]